MDNKYIETINPDLTSKSDITIAIPLRENANICYYGSQQKGSFDITPAKAKELLSVRNPFGLDIRDVVKPSMNGLQILRGGDEAWVIDFGVKTTIEEASKYEAPFEYVKKVVYPERKIVKKNFKGIIGGYMLDHHLVIVRSKNTKTIHIKSSTAKFRVFVWLWQQCFS